MGNWTRKVTILFPRILKDQQAVTAAVAQAFVDIVQLETFENEYKMWQNAGKLSADWGGTETHGVIGTAATPELAAALVSILDGIEGVRWYVHDAASDAILQTNDTRAAVHGLDWRPDMDVDAPDLLFYQGTWYDVITPHRTQADWPPDLAVSLYKPWRPPGVPLAWRQPLGEHDAYPIEARVTVDDVVWISEIDANVWPPGTPGMWRLDGGGDPDPVPAWVQPTGAHDAYAIGAEVMHKGQHWKSTFNGANVWEPGVFGWVLV